MNAKLSITSNLAVLLGVALTVGGLPRPGVAQQRGGEATGGRAEVIIERAPMIIRDPSTYEVPLKLSAAREVTLVSYVDGVVQTLRVKLGDRMAAQSEALQLNSELQQLEFERAKAVYQAALQEQEKGAVPARVEVAEKELRIAELKLERMSVRAPFDGHVFDLRVIEGEFVRAGDPLLTLYDQSTLTVEVPVDRSSVNAGDSIDLKIEQTSVQGTVTATVPLDPKFDPLRNLFPSIASAFVEIDNTSNRFLTGQTVHSPMIPNLPVTEVPTAALSNTGEGDRMVQVIRSSFVRDVPVQLLGQEGETHVWVSGRFDPDDELILQTSEPLLDGTQVTPRTDATDEPTQPQEQRTPPRAPSARPDL